MKQKLLLFSILFTLFIGSAAAQGDKGGYYLGGSLSYNYNSFGSSSTYNYSTGYTIYTTTNIAAFTLSPEFGYFISKKWSIGIQPTYSRNSGTEESDYYSNTAVADDYTSKDNYHSSAVGLGINVRYYCMITDKFGFFPQVGISTLNNSTYFKYGTLTIGGTPNFVFFATPKLGVNLGFGNIGYNLDYKTKDHTLNAGLNDKISFGLNYYWGKK
ncbi:hypothetical protein [Mucilaginibacter sp.]|uniref:hypothetical protein n=1 Tax=Mucilaginibacter sp. TaxID=1882438 RepID=UPI003D0CE8E5